MKKTMRSRKFWLISLIVVLVFTLTACGGNNDATPIPATPTPVSAAPQQPAAADLGSNWVLLPFWYQITTSEITSTTDELTTTTLPITYTWPLVDCGYQPPSVQVFEAWDGSGKEQIEGDAYDLSWDQGMCRFYQRILPAGPERVSHIISIELEAGTVWAFDGVACKMYADWDDNVPESAWFGSQEGKPKPFLANGNGMLFQVESEHSTGYARIECAQSEVTGTGIYFLGYVDDD